MRNMPTKINHKSQITNHKQIPIPNDRNSKAKFWSSVIVCNLVLVIWNFSYAAPCYGTKMPNKNKFFTGLQYHNMFKRYLAHDYGKLRSQQYFILLSYGIFDWFTLDLKGGAGDIRQRPLNRGEIDYSTSFAGGYGIRLRLFEHKNFKSVFGFQHISIHPQSKYIAGTKNSAILDDWQTSLLASYSFKKIMPYLGTRWSRLDYIHKVGDDRKRKMSEYGKSYGLIYGFDLPITQKLWINLEGQAIDSDALAFSVNYSF